MISNIEDVVGRTPAAHEEWMLRREGVEQRSSNLCRYRHVGWEVVRTFSRERQELVFNAFINYFKPVKRVYEFCRKITCIVVYSSVQCLCRRALVSQCKSFTVRCVAVVIINERITACVCIYTRIIVISLMTVQ